MEENSHIKDFRIETLEDGFWIIELVIRSELSDDLSLIKILHDAKRLISERYGITSELLRYKNLKKVGLDSEYTKVSLIIENLAIPSGKSNIRLKKARSNAGIDYDDMILYVDLFLENQAGEKTTTQDILDLLKTNGIQLNLVNMELLKNSIVSLHKMNMPIKDVLLIQGQFPDDSYNAEINYFCGLKKVDEANFIGKERIQKDQLICEKKPPIMGEKPGYNVKGSSIPPREVKDIQMIAGDNIYISEDGTKVYAAEKGILHVHVEKPAQPHIESVLKFSLEPIKVIDGSKPINVITDKPIEVQGGLKPGSKIISQAEVLVFGHISWNTSIQTTGSIQIEGNIIGAFLSSDEDIEAYKDVSSTRLVAEGKLVVKGTAKNSDLFGHEVFVNLVIGCNITAGDKIEVNSVQADEKGFTARLQAGLTHHLEEIVTMNEKFIESANTSLDKLEKVFGERIIRAAGTTNITQMLIIHAENLKKMGIHITTQEKRETVKRLIGTIGPIQELIKEKKESIHLIGRKKVKGFISNPKIIVNSGVEKEVQVDIDGVLGNILPEDGRIRLELSDKDLMKMPS
ncbi:MAG: DUF342 domain-containing protein [candidate division Zixibacteria bacterium]|nr:DUF342 domain-containing protein [Candidatus Tariuqbacter arcticus]